MKRLLVAAFLLTCFTACEEPIPELPAETQTGANTFGCLVNGELVIPYPKHYSNKPYAVYSQLTDTLRITGYGQNNQVFEFTISRPKANQPATIDKAAYYPWGRNQNSYYYGGDNIGEIVLTQFNLIRGVVSGTFHFVGREYSVATGELLDPNDIVTVSLGRFDIKMNIY